MGREPNPDFTEQEGDPSRLDRATEERQSIEELVPDGMEDEANVEDAPEQPAEEEALATEGEGS